MRRILVIAAAFALTLGLAAPPGGAARPVRAAAARPASSTWVTLLTGDRVAVTAGTAGQVDPARRAGPVSFLRETVRGDSYVIPSDAAPLVSSGALDRELFNVTGLVRQGYDDRHATELPLLAQYADPKARAATPTGARRARTLKSANLVALGELKRDASRFWATIHGSQAGAQTLAGGPRRLWLDRKVRVSLDQSVPQVGAPAAWQAGFTGKGVTVAVLDTGYDAGHPELAGRAAATRDFTGSGTVKDGHGHGTHVASTVLGSGTTYRGVAPDATLAVGKVLNDEGEGSTSGVIAGMEWAATEVKAKVVNLSLGGDPSDGTDPLSQAVNQLSSEHGTLFVVAAGNDGADRTVSSPAAADEALAVASVTKTDELSPFSSRGPRLGDFAVKPEIAAPGSGIVAARAAGTSLGQPVSELHTRLSGTSMATPHVAGGAALLAQQHPDWTGAQLKAALTGSARELPGLGVAAVGAGRLDLAAATAQQVHAATTSVSAFYPYATGTPAPQHFPVKYRNTGSTPVELKLDLGTLPAGLVQLSADTVTVPAGGEATVTVTVTGKFDHPGSQFGVLTATAAGVRLRTPIAATMDVESHYLTVRLNDRTGEPAGPDLAQAYIVDAETGKWTVVGDGTRLRLPAKRYSVLGQIGTPRDGQTPSLSMVDQPSLQLGADTTLALDARTAKRVALRPDQPAARGGLHTVVRSVIPSNGARGLSVDSPFEQLDEPYAASVPGSRSDGYTFVALRTATEPAVELTAESPQRFGVFADWAAQSAMPDLSGSIAVVHGGRGTPAELAKVDAKDKLVVLALPSSADPEQPINDVAGAGAKAVIVLITEDDPGLAGLRTTEEHRYPLPTLWTMGPSGDRFGALAAQPGARATLTTNAHPKHRYELALPAKGAIPAVLERRYATTELAAVRSRYYSFEPELRLGAPIFQFGNGSYRPLLASRVTAPVERVEYYSPGKWTLDSEPLGWDGTTLQSELLTLRRGQRTSLDWNKPVYAPSFAHGIDLYGLDRPWAQHEPGAIDVVLPLYADADGNSRTPGGPDDEGAMQLYRDGKLVGATDSAGFGNFPVPAERAAYKLTATNRRTAPWWPLATSTSAEWTFSSAAPAGDPAALPLLYVGFDPAVDMSGRAPGGRAFTFPLTVGRQVGSGAPTVRSLAVQVSYDDGATWRPTSVRRSGAKWTVGVKHPAGGFVSLRAQAADTDGNTAAITVIRAYALR